MNDKDFDKAEKDLMALVVRTRALGGYSPHAENELVFLPILYELLRQVRELSSEMGSKKISAPRKRGNEAEKE